MIIFTAGCPTNHLFLISCAAAEPGKRSSTQRRRVEKYILFSRRCKKQALCNHVCKGFMHEQLHTKWQYKMLDFFIQIRAAAAFQELLDWIQSRLFHLCHLFRCKPCAYKYSRELKANGATSFTSVVPNTQPAETGVTFNSMGWIIPQTLWTHSTFLSSFCDKKGYVGNGYP